MYVHTCSPVIRVTIQRPVGTVYNYTLSLTSLALSETVVQPQPSNWYRVCTYMVCWQDKKGCSDMLGRCLTYLWTPGWVGKSVIFAWYRLARGSKRFQTFQRLRTYIFTHTYVYAAAFISRITYVCRSNEQLSTYSWLSGGRKCMRLNRRVQLHERV